MEQNSFEALNSSYSEVSFIMSSSKIRIVSLSMTCSEKFKAQIVEEYKSASKFIGSNTVTFDMFVNEW